MKRIIEVLAAGITDATGAALDSGEVTFYDAGTTTPKTVYQDFELTLPHPNPATLDAAGRLVAYSDVRLRLVITDSLGSAVHTWDHVGTADSDVASLINTEALDGNGLMFDGDGILNVNVDGTTITTNEGQLSLVENSITQAHLASDVLPITADMLGEDIVPIPRTLLAPLGQQASASVTGYYGVTSSMVDVPNLSVEITTTGRPVFLSLKSAGISGNAGSIMIQSNNTGGAAKLTLNLLRDATLIDEVTLALVQSLPDGIVTITLPPSTYHFIDEPTAGTYTYKVQARLDDGGQSELNKLKLFAFEL